ncbi:MAG: universal stress protein [Chitinophagaceae bacterium]
MAFKKILLAVNDSSYSQLPAKIAFELSRSLGAKMAIVSVIDFRLVVGNAETGVMPNDAIQVLKKDAEMTINQILEKFGGQERVEIFSPEGKPTTEILDTAKKWGADLIVLGTHGRSGIMQLLAGSISTYIKHHAKIPVLIVPSSL